MTTIISQIVRSSFYELSSGPSARLLLLNEKLQQLLRRGKFEEGVLHKQLPVVQSFYSKDFQHTHPTVGDKEIETSQYHSP